MSTWMTLLNKGHMDDYIKDTWMIVLLNKGHMNDYILINK